MRSYSEGEFATPRRTGVPRDESTRNRLMGKVMTRARVQLTDAEIQGLSKFARTLPPGGATAPSSGGETSP